MCNIFSPALKSHSALWSSSCVTTAWPHSTSFSRCAIPSTHPPCWYLLLTVNLRSQTLVALSWCIVNSVYTNVDSIERHFKKIEMFSKASISYWDLEQAHGENMHYMIMYSERQFFYMIFKKSSLFPIVVLCGALWACPSARCWQHTDLRVGLACKGTMISFYCHPFVCVDFFSCLWSHFFMSQFPLFGRRDVGEA